MVEWLLIILMLVLSGFLSGTEIAYVSANRLKLEIRARKNNFGARHLEYFLRNPESFLSTTLIGNNIVNVLYATLMTIFLTDTINNWYFTFSGDFPTEVILLVIKTTVASFFVMVFGEVIPKAMFRTYPDLLISVLSTPLRFLNILFKPFISVATSASKLLIQIFYKDVSVVEDFFKRSDIELLFREIGGDNTGDMDKEDSEILTNVL